MVWYIVLSVLCTTVHCIKPYLMEPAELQTMVFNIAARQMQAELELDVLKGTIAKQDTYIRRLMTKLEKESRHNIVLTSQMVTLKRKTYALLKEMLLLKQRSSEDIIIQTRDTTHVQSNPNESLKNCSEVSIAQRAECNLHQNSRTVKSNTNARIRKTRQVVNNVSFSVYLDHPVIMHERHAIKFNKIISNDGNGYNIFSGVFTCPRAGTYFFYFALGQHNQGIAEAFLIVNNRFLVEAYVEGTVELYEMQGGNAAIVRLNEGDVVYVDGLFHMQSSDTYRVTTFSGFLLYP